MPTYDELFTHHYTTHHRHHTLAAADTSGDHTGDHTPTNTNNNDDDGHRHYGALQGRNKATLEEAMGEVVIEWRRAYGVRPPPMTDAHPHWPLISLDSRYRGLKIPESESLRDTANRVREKEEGKNCCMAVGRGPHDGWKRAVENCVMCRILQGDGVWGEGTLTS